MRSEQEVRAKAAEMREALGRWDPHVPSKVDRDGAWAGAGWLKALEWVLDEPLLTVDDGGSD